MYEWYANACECFVHLQDVRFLEEFRASSWLTRGWTLQELLAPKIVVFCYANWRVMGSHGVKGWFPSPHRIYGRFLLPKLPEITKIPHEYLVRKRRLQEASIAQRMSWASHRKTTRVEDEAYCLLGIFGINMPLIYGGESY